MPEKRDIDRKREGAFTIEICDPDDKTPIRLGFSDSQNFYTIKDKSIYAIKLADDIDPQRTNIHVPNTHQKILEYGFENDLVGRILLLAHKLFVESRLGRDFRCKEALSISLEGTRLLLEMREIHAQLHSDEKVIIEGGFLPDKGRSQNIPTVKNLDTRVKIYIRKADRVRELIIEIFKLAYSAGNDKKTLENLKASITEKHGEESDFVKYFNENEVFLRFFRNLRNGDEHPKEKERTVIRDFNLRPEGNCDPPTIELIHPLTPQEQTPISAFMEQVNTTLVNIFECVIFMVCRNNMWNFGNFECEITEMPLERRHHRDTRFCYAMKLNGQWIPLG